MTKKRLILAIVGYVALFLLAAYTGFVFDLALQA